MKRYEAVWAMVHKLRSAMGQRDDRYTFEGMIEMDEGYFTIEASPKHHATQKAGRGSKTKALFRNKMYRIGDVILFSNDLPAGKGRGKKRSYSLS